MIAPNYLLIAAAILVTILSVWAQIWINRTSDENEGKKITASLGLFWIYMAILYAMTAIAFVLVGQYWEGLSYSCKSIMTDFGFGCFITAFIMGLVNIGESTLSAFIKGWRRQVAFDSLGDSIKLDRGWYIKLAVLALSIFIISTLGVIFYHWVYLGYIIIAGYGAFQYYRLVCRKS